MPRNKAKNMARAVAHRAEKIQQRNFEHRIVRLLSAGNERVEAALNGPSVRDLAQESGAMCLPDVALYAAGHRKSESVTAR